MLAAIGCFVTVYNFYYGFSKLEYILPGVAGALGLSLPLFTMNLFAKDRKAKTDKLIYSLPISNKAVVFGKYGALLCFIIICIAVLAIVPIFLSFFADIYFASAYLTLICFILFAAAMLALYTFISVATSSTSSALLSVSISYIAAIGSFALYLIPTGSGDGAWKTIAEILRFLSPFYHLYTFLYGAFDITSIVYFILLTALFLFLAVRAYSRKRIVDTCGKKSPELKSFPLSSALAIILAVCTLATGTLMSFVPYTYSKFDMTSEKTISLRDETKEFISSIDKDIGIYVINPDSSDKAFEHLVKLFDESSDNITVHF
jgi:ABC-2 type transport system permease protein